MRSTPAAGMPGSNIPWVESLPASWSTSRLKFVLSRTVSGGTPATNDPEYWADDEGGLPWVTIGDMSDQEEVTATEKQVTEAGIQAANMRPLEPGTILYAMYASVGEVATLDVRAVTNQAIIGLVPDPVAIYPGFVRWWLEDVKRNIRYLTSTTTQDNLNAEKVRGIPIALPPRTEQRAIADFLDEKTAAIDQIVEDKRRLIRHLEEEQEALIYEAICGRFSPRNLFSDSTIPWIDSLPAHWDVSPVFARFDVQLGKMLNRKAAEGEHQAPYLRNVDVRWGTVDVDNLPTMSFDERERIKYRLVPGDLLVCEGGEVGRTAVWDGELEECFYQKALHRVRPRDRSRDLPRFFYYLMRAAASCDALEAEGDRSTITHLTAEKLRRLRFPFPPRAEQEEIVRRLDAAVGELSQAASDLRQQVMRLQEYRTSLITAAVTGQINVRASTPAVA